MGHLNVTHYLQQLGIEPGLRAKLQHLEDRYLHWFEMPDASLLRVTIASYVANLLPAPPFWIFIVGSPSSGKTVTIQLLTDVPDMYPICDITEAGLLSGCPSRDKARKGTGGLLKSIGDFGVIAVKDLTTLLSGHYEKQMTVFAVFRDMYDGEYIRTLGTEGGRQFIWQGKVGLLACVTQVIDSHHLPRTQMGERFLMFRLAQPTDSGIRQARKALMNTGREDEARQELSELVSGLVGDVSIPTTIPILPPTLADGLVSLADVVVHARGVVPRDSYHRDITSEPIIERPPRFAKQLKTILNALLVIGADVETVWGDVRRIAFDSIPPLRRRVLDFLVGSADYQTTGEIIDAIKMPKTTTTRLLEELHLLDCLDRISGSGRNADRWTASSRIRFGLQAIDCIKDQLCDPGISEDCEQVAQKQIDEGAPDVSGTQTEIVSIEKHEDYVWADCDEGYAGCEALSAGVSDSISKCTALVCADFYKSLSHPYGRMMKGLKQ